MRLGSEFQVNTYTTSAQTSPSVAASASGGFVVAWQSLFQDGTYAGVFARLFSSAGAAVASEFQVNTRTLSGQYDPSVAADADGDFIVTWYSTLQDGSSHGVAARPFSSAGAALASEFQVNVYTIDAQRYPSVAAGAKGDFIVAWQSARDGSSDGVFARLFSSAGAALTSEFQVNTYTTGDQRHPSVAAEANGDFIVAWESPRDGSSQGIFARRFMSTGNALTSELQVNTHTISGQYRPSVAADGDGDFVVAWYSDDQDGSDSGVFARLFSSTGAALACEFQANAYTNGSQAVPSVAAAEGDFVVAWRSFGQDGSDFAVFARRVSSAGLALGSEFQVNSYTSLVQNRPSVAAAASGDFVVAWDSAGQDGYAQGVFAQRFAAPKILDIDGDGAVAPLTDGLLALRFLFGFTGTTLTSGAVNTDGCTRCDAGAIEPYLQTLI
jgi:hypothetical protein